MVCVTKCPQQVTSATFVDAVNKTDDLFFEHVPRRGDSQEFLDAGKLGRLLTPFFNRLPVLEFRYVRTCCGCERGLEQVVPHLVFALEWNYVAIAQCVSTTCVHRLCRPLDAIERQRHRRVRHEEQEDVDQVRELHPVAPKVARRTKVTDAKRQRYVSTVFCGGLTQSPPRGF